MATTLTYGDVILHNVLTERWDQEITYDESGTDMIGQKHTIRVRGILHAQRVPITNSKTYITHVPQPATVFTLLDNVRSLLFQPRQKLEIKIAGLEEAGVFGDPIVTEVTAVSEFYPAEEEHQQFYRRNGNQQYCQLVISPKLAKFRMEHLDKLRPVVST